MGTYSRIYLEHKVNGEWEESYHDSIEFKKAHISIESQDYFKFAFLSDIRNYWMLKEVTNGLELSERDEVRREEIREEWGLNEPKFYPCESDWLYEYYAKYEISLSVVRYLDSPYSYLSDIHMIDDLLNFDYNREIEYDEDREKHLDEKFLDKMRYVEADETRYIDHLEYFVDALKVLKAHGVERILITYD